MPIRNLGTIEQLRGRRAADSQLADSEDISDGVEAEIGDVAYLTLYLAVESAIDVTVELSPDGGSTWYEPGGAKTTPGESPISFDNAATEILSLGYQPTAIRLTGSNNTAVSAQLREVV